MTDRYPELAGQTAIVTGGSRGIGATTVADLARAGAYVFFNYRSASAEADALVAELGADRVRAVQADLEDPANVDRVWHEARAWRGEVDIVVHNASLRRPVELDAGTEAWNERWLEALRVNLIAPALLSRHAIEHWLERGSGGVMVGLTGRIAVRGDWPGYLHDGAAKGGLNSLMRGIARGYAQEGILTYLVSGGIIETDQARDQIKSHGEDDRFLREIPMGEYGTPGDISELILFLATRRARYATGSTISATGGSFLY